MPTRYRQGWKQYHVDAGRRTFGVTDLIALCALGSVFVVCLFLSV